MIPTESLGPTVTFFFMIWTAASRAVSKWLVWISSYFGSSLGADMDSEQSIQKRITSRLLSKY